MPAVSGVKTCTVNVDRYYVKLPDYIGILSLIPSSANTYKRTVFSLSGMETKAELC